MPNTTPDNIYFPDNSTAVDDLAGLFASQATSVQAALSALRTALAPVPITDTGWTLNGLVPSSPAWVGITDPDGLSGTSVKGGMRKVGNLVELRFRATRGGATLTANSQGNIGDSLLANITNTAFRPAGTVYGTFDFGPTMGTGGFRVQPDGAIYVVDAYPNAKINSGSTIQCGVNYFTG